MKSRGTQVLAVAAVLSSAIVAYPDQQSAAREDATAVIIGPGPAPAGPEVPRYEPPEGVVIFDNGPLVTHPGQGGGGLDASALQGSLGMTTFGYGAQAAGPNRLADDFTVPAGQSMTIESIVVFCYQTNAPTPTSPITSVNLQIWNGVPEAPGSTVVFGDLTTNRLASSTFSNIYRVTETTLTNTARAVWANRVTVNTTLPAGTYWIDWMATGNAALAGPFVPPVTILGQSTTGNAMQKAGAAGVFTALIDVGPQGIPFQLQASRPAALAVTGGDGNGVWEPAEAVTIQPSWTGGVVASSNVTGAGVGGGNFTLTDAAAAYGTLPANTVVSCAAATNCYGATADGTRPGTHWDVTMTETLNIGDTKAWTLHIGSSFTDVPLTNPFYRFIETLLHKSVTGGCGTNLYCPSNTTTREQMAAFVLVAKEGAGYTPAACGTPIFTDVPASSPFCRFVEELSRRGVVSGCGTNLYCPTANVSREQMAVFVLRTLDPTLNPPDCVAPNTFTDVPETSPFCKWIEELARRGVVGGCGPNIYCPTNPVTRDQIGVFLTLTFSLSLYGL